MADGKAESEANGPLVDHIDPYFVGPASFSALKQYKALVRGKRWQNQFWSPARRAALAG